MLRSGWKLKHLKALTSPTGLGENLCQIEQEWTDRKTELEILVRCKVKAWVTFWCHWYPVSLNVWFIGKQNFGCYLKNSDNIRFLHSTVAESINRETNHFSDPLSSLSLMFILEAFKNMYKARYGPNFFLTCSTRDQVETLQINNVHVGWRHLWAMVVRVYSPGGVHSVHDIISYTPGGDKLDVTSCHLTSNLVTWAFFSRNGSLHGAPLFCVWSQVVMGTLALIPRSPLPGSGWGSAVQFTTCVGHPGTPAGKYTAWHSHPRWFRAEFPSGTWSLTDSEKKLLGSLTKCKQWFMNW